MFHLLFVLNMWYMKGFNIVIFCNSNTIFRSARYVFVTEDWCIQHRAIFYYIASMNKCQYEALKCIDEACSTVCVDTPGCRTNMGFHVNQTSEPGIYIVNLTNKTTDCEKQNTKTKTSTTTSFTSAPFTTTSVKSATDQAVSSSDDEEDSFTTDSTTSVPVSTAHSTKALVISSSPYSDSFTTATSVPISTAHSTTAQDIASSNDEDESFTTDSTQGISLSPSTSDTSTTTEPTTAEISTTSQCDTAPVSTDLDTTSSSTYYSIKFLAFTRQHQVNGILLDENDSAWINVFQPDGHPRKMKLIIHGFGSSSNAKWVSDMKDELLKEVSEFDLFPIRKH